MSAPYWLNGELVTAGGGLSPRDRGFLHGLGVFETMGAVGGELPLWDRHLARLRDGAQRLAIPFDPPPGLRDAAAALLARSGQRDGILRLTLTAGVEAPSPAPTWCLTTRPRPAAGPVRLAEVVVDRHPLDPSAGIKCTSRAFYEVPLAAARARGAEDVLLVDGCGCVLETARANVFAALDGVLVTPPLDGRIVPGIARAVLLEALAAEGTPCREQPLTLAAVHDADAVWVTNAVHGPRPAGLEGANIPPDNPLARLWPLPPD